MMSLKEFIDESGIDYFVIELTTDLVPRTALINEGLWVASGKKDWMQRVDPERPNMNQQRHVHVARSKHVNSKDRQASWNADGTKHDQKSFNSKIGSIRTVQDIARQALNLSRDFKLEEASRAANLLFQLNEAVEIPVQPVLFILTQGIITDI